MIPADREWFAFAGASAEALAELKETMPIGVPASYFNLLAYSDGGEGPLPVQPFNFVLDPVEVMLESSRGSDESEYFSGLLRFGGNGGGEAFAFDMRRNAPYPIVYYDMCNIDLEESVVTVGSDFDAFLALIGLPEDRQGREPLA